jgi:hypothetical protein
MKNVTEIGFLNNIRVFFYRRFFDVENTQLVCHRREFASHQVGNEGLVQYDTHSSFSGIKTRVYTDTDMLLFCSPDTSLGHISRSLGPTYKYYLLDPFFEEKKMKQPKREVKTMSR